MKTISTLFTFLLISITIHSQVFVKTDATGNNDGTSWNDAYPNLQDAFDNANAGDQIWITAGTYLPMNNALSTENWFAVNQGLEIYGGFVGTETMLSERDWETNITILSGDVNGDDVEDDFDNFRMDNAIHVLWISGGNQNILDGLVISGGQTSLDIVPMNITSAEVAPWSGGGCYVTANATIRNCTFRQCNGTYGSAFEADFADELLVENCTFENNKTLQGAAGFRWMGNPVIRNCHFENNFTLERGAGLSIGLTNALVEDCTFENNIGTFAGGGIYIFQNQLTTFDNPLVVVRRCDFTNNTSTYGGGMCFLNAYPNSQIIIDSCNFNENISPAGLQGSGGGLLIQNYFDDSSPDPSTIDATISNCIFMKNTGYFAGGVYLLSNRYQSNFIVSNCDFIENSADVWGGGLVFGNIDGVIEDCTFQKNESSTSIGGGLFIFQNPNRVYPNPSTVIKRSDFQENNALVGGGICFNNFFPNSNIEIDSVTFFQNTATLRGAGLSLQNLVDNFGGGIPSLSASVMNSNFEENETETGAGGYFYSESDVLEIFTANNRFIKNVASASGAGLFAEKAIIGAFMKLSIHQTTFLENEAFQSGAALDNVNLNETIMETVLMNDNLGFSTISNSRNLSMTNTTMINNEGGLFQSDGGIATLQNNIFANSDENYVEAGNAEVITRGGNLSSDATLEDVLIGFGTYADYNETDPQLDMDFVPASTSIAIDGGNPDGITNPLDLAGMDRVQGDQIDIGAFESPFAVAVEDFEKLGIDVYPNPFIDRVHLSNIEGIKSLRMLNVEGKLVQVFSVQQELIIPNDLPVGVYFLELNYGEKQYYAKLEKQN
ncbi:MAG: T9SS type A sorting domain-containing protein [Saprospiraceae bacterium]